MAHLPPHSLFLLFLAVHGFVASHGSPLPPSSTYNDSMCSESFRCGDVDIKYPFYLSDATVTTPDYTSNFSCGYTDLKIFCQVEGGIKTPILRLDKDKYTILNIFYDNRTIILGDTEALASGSKCPAVNHNVTFSRDWLNYTHSLGELTFFYGCSPQSDIEDHQIDCKGFNPPPGIEDGLSFVFTSEEGKFSREHELAGDCSLVVTVPVHEKAPVRGGPLMWPRDYGGVLNQGFELEWKENDKEQQCYPCERSGGRCAYSEKVFLGCLCSGGKVGAHDCNSSGGATTEYAYPPSHRTMTMCSVVLPPGVSFLLEHVLARGVLRWNSVVFRVEVDDSRQCGVAGS